MAGKQEDPGTVLTTCPHAAKCQLNHTLGVELTRACWCFSCSTGAKEAWGDTVRHGTLPAAIAGRAGGTGHALLLSNRGRGGSGVGGQTRHGVAWRAGRASAGERCGGGR